jgi:hypothetical protein
VTSTAMARTLKIVRTGRWARLERTSLFIKASESVADSLSLSEPCVPDWKGRRQVEMVHAKEIQAPPGLPSLESPVASRHPELSSIW